MKEQYNSYYNDKTRHPYKNSLLLFVRIFVITIINLYAVRLTVNGLGVIDYGIFNAVVGVVMTLSCVFPVLAVSVQRFFSSAMGRGDNAKLRVIFSASINIVMASIVVIAILLETIGFYVINTQMQIPTESLVAAHWIFHLSIFTFAFSFLQIPFTAAVFAHEDMNVYAVVSCVDCVLKLLVAILINQFVVGRLTLYVGGLTVVSLCTLLCYAMTCIRHYDECHYMIVSDKKIYKEMLSFSGWTMYGALAGICMIQGNTILLNVFFGPLANTAFGIANNIYNAFTSLTNSVVLAFRPRMIKSYAAKDFDYLDRLFAANNKFIFTLLLAVAIPIIAEIDTIIHLWLGKLTENMVIFSRLLIVYTIILALHNPITTIMQASGKIKIYHMLVETITILSLPLSWLQFKLGMPAYSAFLTMITLALLAHVTRIVILYHNYPRFSPRNYITNFIVPSLVVGTLCSIGAYALHISIEYNLLRLMAMMLLSPAITLIFTYVIITSHEEKKAIKKITKKTLISIPKVISKKV